MSHDPKLAIPKATADEVPPGLTNVGLQKHFGIGYYQVKLWAFHTGYQMNCSLGRPKDRVPDVPRADMPEGLCHYEVAHRLGVGRDMAKRWANSVGYRLVDGRSKYAGRYQSLKDYRPDLEAGVGKTLQEVGDKLGLTRERVRQLYEKHGIKRENNPHSCYKDAALVDKVRELAKTARNMKEIGRAVGLEWISVSRILQFHKIPFKNWIQKRLEEELATGLRTCTKCFNPKPLSDYFNQHDGRLGKMELCKDCLCLSHRKYRERRGVKERPDKVAYWERLKRERGIKADDVQNPKPSQPVKPRVIHIAPPPFGLSPEQINKLKEGKM